MDATGHLYQRADVFVPRDSARYADPDDATGDTWALAEALLALRIWAHNNSVNWDEALARAEYDAITDHGVPK